MTKPAIWLPLGLIAAVAFGIMGLVSSSQSANGQTGSAVFAVTAVSAVAPNGSVVVDLSVTPTGVSGVGAFSVDIVDDALVSATACTGVTGVICNEAFAADTVRFTGAATPPGLTGNIGTITYLAGATEGTSNLTVNVDAAACTDADTNPITCTGTNGTIVIAQATATPSPSPSPSPAPTSPGASPTGTGAAGSVTPTRSPTPAGLPPTGGSDDGSSSLPWLLAAMGVAGATAAAWATMRLRRVKA
jgi:hypothetical protein